MLFYTEAFSFLKNNELLNQLKFTFSSPIVELVIREQYSIFCKLNTS